MQEWRKFKGGPQNATNVLNLGKEAWGLGRAAGNALIDAFGLGAKKFPRNLRTCWQKERRRWRPGIPE